MILERQRGDIFEQVPESRELHAELSLTRIRELRCGEILRVLGMPEELAKNYPGVPFSYDGQVYRWRPPNIHDSLHHAETYGAGKLKGE